MHAGQYGFLSLFFTLHFSLAIATSPAGIAGTINNAVQASILQAAALLPSPGGYILKNVATGQTLTYVPDGNHISPVSHSAGSPVTVSHYGGATNWIRLAVGAKNKCLSSQWGGSYDHAAVAYQCAVSSGGKTVSGNTLEPTKQWWIMVPVSANLVDPADQASNKLLAAAQQDSVKTRNKAIADGTSKNAFANKRGLSAKGNHGSHAERRHHDEAARHERRAKKKARKVRKAKISSRSNSNAYWIIPTDHLIDMHTMALTGTTITTAGNAASTALTLFDPTNELQHWIVTPTS